MHASINFIEGNTRRCFMAMVLPMIFAMFLNMMYNLVDSLWIGNMLGETAYAALTNSTPVILLLTSIAMGATNGISILLSQAVGYLAVYLYLYFTAVLRSFGNSMFQAAAMLISTILNAILDPIFITWFGFHGAAAATLLSQGICLIFMLVYLRRKRFFVFRISRFNTSYILLLIQKALPSVVQQSIPAISTTFLTALVSSYSVTANGPIARGTI